MKTVDRTTGTQRHDSKLQQSVFLIGFKLGVASQLLAEASLARRTQDQEEILARVTKVVKEAEKEACDLYGEVTDLDRLHQRLLKVDTELAQLARLVSTWGEEAARAAKKASPKLMLLKGTATRKEG